jgi:apolipoprotein D and lipocalin family protein
MELSFFRPFWASYRIIEVVGDYQVIVAMGSDLTSLWILGRSRHLDRNTFVAIKKDLDGKGFDTSQLIVAPGVDQ